MNTSSVPRSRTGPKIFLVLGLGVCLLALGFWLRTAHLGSMSQLLHHDEAWYALNAVDLIEHPRFVTFFPENYGRESSWMYVLAGWMLTVGRGIAELRLLAALVGVLTLAATYRLARELFGVGAGLGALAALTVLFWHVMISSHVVRLNFALLLVALAGLAWARAVRRGGTGRWIRAGAAAGLLAYSYFAAWGLLAFLLGGGLILAVARPSLRRGVALAWVTAALVVTPQAYYALTHAGLFTTRSATVARFDLSTIAANVWAWLKAWWVQGDLDDHYNLSGRPVLGVVATLALGLGVAVALVDAWRSRNRADGRLGGLVVLAAFGVALAPSLLTADAPSYSRGAMAIVPLALLLGLALGRLGEWLKARWPRPMAPFLPWLLIVPMAVSGYQDMGNWVDFASRTAFMEAPLIHGLRLVATTPDDRPVYFSPFTPTHPVVRYLSPSLAPRQVGAFDSHQCLVLADRTATYFSLSAFEDLAGQLAPWADVVIDEQRQDQAGATLLEATPRAALTGALANAPSGTFSDRLSVWLLSVSDPTPDPGDVITLTLALKATTPTDVPLGAFVHVYGDPSPYEGGRIWAQSDAGLCDSYPPTDWRTNETVLQSFTLTMPPDLAAGPYQLVFGLYTYPDIVRLPITAPEPGAPHVVLYAWNTQP